MMHDDNRQVKADINNTMDNSTSDMENSYFYENIDPDDSVATSKFITAGEMQN